MKLPPYAFIGLGMLAISEIAMFARVEPFWSWHTPIAWTIDYVFIILGAAMLIWPIVWPSPYLAAPVWLGFIFLLDPLNYRAGDESLTGDIRRGSWERTINLTLAGLVCGVLWEFWNYWARAKWIYTVPVMSEWKIFEMPLPGYLGFPVFGVECFTMYVFLRRLIWRGSRRQIGIIQRTPQVILTR